MNRCDWQYRTLALASYVNPSAEVEAHINTCLRCQLRTKFVEATKRSFAHQSNSPSCLPITLAALVQKCTRFEDECVVEDSRNQRLVVKQDYCFCGLLARSIPVPLREEQEQRVNLECVVCGARWRAAHCRSGCGAPLDDRFDEICPECNWIKCPQGHCSNDECLDPENL